MTSVNLNADLMMMMMMMIITTCSDFFPDLQIVSFLIPNFIFT